MQSSHEIKMWTPRTMVLSLFIIVGFFAILYRMSVGLGAATNLSDTYPWGFWLGLDVLGGVAMAAGGFLIAAAVYIFNWKKYKPIVRPALFTAFIGYLLTVIAIFLDIGHPFRLWHPLIMWQFHSLMWIVAIHEMLYVTTLAAESSPVFFKRWQWDRAEKTVKRAIVGLVILGAVLSVNHQMILGALYLIAPAKMSPLWFNSFLPYIFLVSAVALGLAVVNTETILSARAFGHKIDPQICRGLARGLLLTLALYFFLKLFFLLKNAGLSAAFNGSMPGNMYLLEMVLGVIIPALILLSPALRDRQGSILTANILVIIGILLNRLNIAIFSMQDYAVSRGAEYFPSLNEFLVTIGLLSLGIFLYKLAAKYLPLFSAT